MKKNIILILSLLINQKIFNTDIDEYNSNLGFEKLMRFYNNFISKKIDKVSAQVRACQFLNRHCTKDEICHLHDCAQKEFFSLGDSVVARFLIYIHHGEIQDSDYSDNQSVVEICDDTEYAEYFKKSAFLAKMLIAKECIEDRISIEIAVKLQKTEEFFSDASKYIYDHFSGEEIDRLYDLAQNGFWSFKNNNDPVVEKFIKTKISWSKGMIIYPYDWKTSDS